MQYFIKENYYFDIDHYNQLRITGPQNHLLLGLPFPPEVPIEILEYYLDKKQLVIKLEVPVSRLELALPLVTDIRTLRNYIEPAQPKPTYKQLIEQGVVDVKPREIIKRKRHQKQTIQFRNKYTNEAGKVSTYGAAIEMGPQDTLEVKNDKLILAGTEPLQIIIRTISTVKPGRFLARKVVYPRKPLPTEIFTPFLVGLFEKSQAQITHLIKTNKTSGFEYGTIFPRDWIESADLGKGDLTQTTIDYMYKQSMDYISEEGEGWHENLVGEFKSKTLDSSLHIDRKMIDIEPRFILGIKSISKKLLTDEDIRKKLRLVARFILKNAAEHDYITFKKIATSTDEYHFVGNWRDSYYAFPRQKSPLAPYDVNCILYPLSLKLIKEFHDYFLIDDIELLQGLIDKWSHQKEKFRLYHPDGIIGYTLALHGKKNVPLPIAHLDECYDLFYGYPSMEEVASFARKLVDPDYFYTPVGPLLVSADEDEFTTQHYHGKVIWPKQTAYAVAGLTRQYKRGEAEIWPLPVMQSIRHAILLTSEASFNGWTDLGAVPELYYYDENTHSARFYTDQTDYEGQMSLIQLWSSVGCRRIINDYQEMVHKDPTIHTP